MWTPHVPWHACALICAHLSHLLSPCVHLCPLVSMCVLLCPIRIFTTSFLLLNSELERCFSYTSTDNSSVNVSLFSLYPLEIQVKFRSPSAVAPPKETKDRLDRLSQVCISWSQGKVDKGSRGREETRLPSTTLLVSTAGVC